MRRSLWLVAASAWLLLAACGDQPEPRAPIAPPPRGDAHAAAPRRESPPGGGREGAAEPAENALEIVTPPDATAAPASPGLSSAALAARYGKASALAVQHGSASYYSNAFAGRKTASGEPYRPSAFTAAHRSLPFGSVLRVTRVDGGQRVYVRVTDRGPFGPRGRIVDLSRAAAEALGMLRAGVVKVRLEVVAYGPARRKRKQRRH